MCVSIVIILILVWVDVLEPEYNQNTTLFAKQFLFLNEAYIYYKIFSMSFLNFVSY